MTGDERRLRATIPTRRFQAEDSKPKIKMNKNIMERVAALSPEQLKLLNLMRNKNAPASEASMERTAETASPAEPPASDLSPAELKEVSARKSISFSLFFFSDDGAAKSDRKYRLLLDCAKFADQYGFTAVWTPERHFMPFGGL